MSIFLGTGPNEARFVGAETGRRVGGRRADAAGRARQECMVFAKREIQERAAGKETLMKLCVCSFIAQALGLWTRVGACLVVAFLIN